MEVSIETPQKRFDEHLAIENNNRILFSGKFGTGKSHFLRKYFEQNEDKYNLFWISPVDYVVGANQDIFEWIKIDIAKELLAKYLIDKDEEPFSKELMIQTYLYNNVGSIFSTLLTKLSKEIITKKTDVDLFEDFKKHIENFKAFEKDVKADGKSQFKKLAEHINESTQIKGSIYEDDFVTLIIRNSIEFLKFQTGKECVIVIDDLDRLDPEHIFRILNILSAHNNHFDSNKFGFQKVIVVCDIENIEHLFEYRYGPKSDFEGYIEKYFTYEPFHFSIIDSISFFCESNRAIREIDEANTTFFSLMLKSFAESGLLKIRNIKKIFDIHIFKQLPIEDYETVLNRYYNQSNIRDYSFIGNGVVKIDYNGYGLLKVIYILSIAFGGIGQLEKALEALIKMNNNVDKKHHATITKSLFIISHLSKTLKTNDAHAISNAFFRMESNEMTVTYPRLPTANFLTVKFEIPLKWNNHSKYMNDEYFQMSHENSISDILANKANGNSITYMNWANVGREILIVIDFVKKQQFFENM